MDENRYDNNGYDNNRLNPENSHSQSTQDSGSSTYRTTGEELTDSIYRTVDDTVSGGSYRRENSYGQYTDTGSTASTDASGSSNSTYAGGTGYSAYGGSENTGGASYSAYGSGESTGNAQGSYTYQNNQRYTYNPYQNQSQTKQKKKFTFNKNGFGAKLGKVAAIGLVFGLVAGVTMSGASAVTSKLAGTENVVENTSKALTKGDDKIGVTGTSSAVTVTDVSDVADNVMPAIVQVTCITVTEYQNWFGQTFQDESEGAGSGIIMSKDDDYLYIATNNHVVSGARDVTITFNDETAVAAEIQGTDPSMDLAVVKVKLKDIADSTMDAIKVATVGSSDELKVGESAIVIGNALGYGQSVTAGVISATGRDVQAQDEQGNITTNTLIQTDAAINPGNSGGALLNIKGEVIGIVSSKLASTEIEGTGYAIPISQASDIITGLMNGEKENEEQAAGNGAYMGIHGVDIDSATASTYNMPAGVYVSQVISGTGAHLGGIQKGDVITKFEGKDINSMKELQAAIAKKKPNDKVKVTVQRKDRNEYTEKTLEITLGEEDN